MILETSAPLHVPFRSAMATALMHDELRDAAHKHAYRGPVLSLENDTRSPVSAEFDEA